MTPFTVYNELSGEIVRTGKASNASVAKKQASEGCAVFLVNSSDATQYVAAGEIVNRPTITIADEATIGIPIVAEGIPSGVDIKVNGETVGISDGTDVELTFDLDGDYEVSIVPPFPHVPIKTTIKVSP